MKLKICIFKLSHAPLYLFAMKTDSTGPEAGRIAQTLREAYAGPAWHGPAVRDILREITPGQAAGRPIPEVHSIWEIVLHMTAWRQFVWHKLAGDPAFDLASPEGDWPAVENDSLPAWKATLTALERSQWQLLEALQSLPDARLAEMVPGRNYSYYKLLHGIIAHDLYHGGQIMLLKKVL